MSDSGRASDRLAELREEVSRDRARAAGTGKDTAASPFDGAGANRVRDGGARRVTHRRVARWLGVVAVAAVLPFAVLLRGSTWLYATGRLGAWAALAAGALLTFLLLAGYMLVAAWYVRGRFGIGRTAVPKRLLQGAAVLVVAYCGYGLVFLSGANAKTEGVRAEYRALHPLLRMAVGTLVLVDSDLLVTDAGRTLDDYAAMGLPPNEASLHLEQPDGHTHALDLRTAGRPEALNLLTRGYFAALGFRTLRHVGTADHLHVSLPVPE